MTAPAWWIEGARAVAYVRPRSATVVYRLGRNVVVQRMSRREAEWLLMQGHARRLKYAGWRNEATLWWIEYCVDSLAETWWREVGP